LESQAKCLSKSLSGSITKLSLIKSDVKIGEDERFLIGTTGAGGIIFECLKMRKRKRKKRKKRKKKIRKKGGRRELNLK